MKKLISWLKALLVTILIFTLGIAGIAGVIWVSIQVDADQFAIGMVVVLFVAMAIAIKEIVFKHD